jgi:hypothetical protein
MPKKGEDIPRRQKPDLISSTYGMAEQLAEKRLFITPAILKSSPGG